MNKIYFTILLTIIILLTGCDKTKTINNYLEIQGRASDGIIKNATIFLDSNRNGLLDNNEPSTKSNERGFFALRISQELANDYSLPLVATGGYSISEQKEYNNTLMAFRDKTSSKVVLTPISTLIAANIIDILNKDKNLRLLSKKITNDKLFSLLIQTQEAFAKLFELEIELLSKDPIELAIKYNDTKLLESNMKVSKVAREIKQAIKKDLKAKTKAAIQSFKALSKALKKAQKEAKKGDEALAEAITIIDIVAPEAFDRTLIQDVKASASYTLQSFNQEWKSNKVEIIQALKEQKELPTTTKNNQTKEDNSTNNSDNNQTKETNTTKENNQSKQNSTSQQENNNSIEKNETKKTPEKVVDTTPPTITLKGDNPQVIEFGKVYEELGAVARDDVDGDVNVTIVADVETNKLGEYKVVYKAKDSAGNEATITRVVKVVDTTPPRITLFGEENTTLELGESYKETGFEAIDNVDGNITNKVEVIGTIDSNTTGSYTLTYKVVDSSGNEANVTRVVNVITPKDTTAPKIILNGEKELSLILGNPYKELGAKAVDDVDGDINVTIISNVNDTKLGEYQVIYLAKDSAGNEANATRVVKIISPEVLVSHLSFIEKKCGHFESIPLEGSYVLNNNDWGRNKLTNNENGIQCVFTLEDEQGIKGGWFWGWPNSDEGGVKGYPEAIYGKKFSHQVNLEGILPQKVKDLDQVNIDVEYKDFNITGRYNIALESWLHTTNDSSMDDIRYEVMVRFDPDGFHPGKRLLFAENVDIDGITYTVYKKQEPDNPNRYFYNFVAQKKVTKISFDFKKFLDYLKENDPKTCSDIDELYYNDIEMGVETVNGSGVLILNKFNVDITLKNKPLSLSGTPEKSEINLYDEFKFTPEVNGTDISFEAQNLPQGLEVNSTTGTISGIVTQAGEFNDITLIAKSGESNATLSFDLKVLSQKEQLAEPLAQAIANSNEEKIVEYESEIVFEDSINRFKEYYGALPTKTIKVFKDNPKLKKALASITTDGELEVFVLQNFEDMLREFKDKANLENYYNILFGYAVEAGSSGIYNEQVFWDGWGDHIGHYGAHEIWSKEDEALFKAAEESIRVNGKIVGVPNEKLDNFSIYLSEKYKLTTLERYLIRKWNGYYYNKYLANALKNNVDLVNTPLKELIDNHKLQLPLINTYLKIKGLDPRPLSDLKELIDNYMAQKGYSSYKEYFVNFDANKEEIKEDHLGSRYDVWFLKPYLRKVVGLDKQARVDAMPALSLAKRVIELYESKAESDYWPILKDQITQRPWQLYALDEGSEAKGCEWVQKRFFEDDPQVRSDMITKLGTKINLKKSKYTQRLVTYSTYNSPWTDPDIWYQGSNYHPEFSVPVIVRQGGICGHQGTLEQHSKSCLGVPTLGRAEPIHRCLVEVTLDSNTQNYKAVIRQGVFEKGYRGTLLQAPFRTNFDKEVREWGGERVDGLVNALTPSSDGFGSNLTKAMILQRLAAKDSNNSEFLLKEAIALYPSNPTNWYQLALTYAQNNQEQKVIDLANEYLSKLDNIPLESQNQDLMTKDYEKLTAWGIVSSLVAKQTPNAIDLSLEFIENNFQSGFLLEGYKEMFKMLKEQNATNWKEQSQKVFETMLKYNSLNRFPNYGFWGVASWYWDEDTDFINQMKDLVINSTTASDEFKRNILKIIFQEDNIYIKQVKFAQQDAVLVKTIAISDKDSQNLFITTNSFPNEVLPEDKGKEGYKILDVNVTNENGELYTLKMRVAKEYNNTLIAPNDSTGPVEGDTKFLFWIDAKDNENLPTSTYSTVEAVKIIHKGYRKNTYYDIGESILVISALKIFPEFETTTLEMNTTHIDFNVGDTSDTTYNFYNNPNFIDDTIGVKGKTSFNITVVDTNDNEYSLPVDMYQILANVSGKPIYKADSAGPWKGGGYNYRFNIDVNTSKVNSDLKGKIISSKKPLIIYKRAWHLNHKIVEKIIFTIKDLLIPE